MTVDRARFEALLFELSTGLVALEGSAIDRAIGAALERVVTFLDLDVGLMGEVRPDRGGVDMTNRWMRPHLLAAAGDVSSEEFPWVNARVLRGEPTRAVRVSDFPPDTADRRSFVRRGFRSGIVCPVVVAGVPTAGVAFISVRHEREWPDEVVQRLHLLGQMFASALANKRAYERLQREKELAEAIIESLPGLFFMTDQDGRLVRWNRNREVVTGLSADELAGRHFLGSTGPEERARIMRDVEHALLLGEGGLEHEVVTREGRRIPHVARGTRFEVGNATYLLGTAIDVSALRAAEEQVRRQQAELAHVARVSAVGELVAAIAHELNQPLAAIRTNAQAGRRMVAGEHADRAEVTEAFVDIASDAVRADQIIKRLRHLLRKGEIRGARFA